MIGKSRGNQRLGGTALSAPLSAEFYNSRSFQRIDLGTLWFNR
ncbi:MAG: hypothetical protein ABIN99_13095 [Nitrosospira sp.]